MVINLIHTGQFSQYPEINCKIVTLKKYQIFFICIENTFFKDTLIVTLIYTWYRSAEQETTSAMLNT